MALDKLGKQLKRELKTNPKKVGMLAVLGLVAVWFWLPLILPKGEDQPAAVAETPAPTTPATTTTPTDVAAAKSKPAFNWQELAKAIDFDPRMATGNVPELAKTTRNPFNHTAEQQAEIKQQLEAAKRKQEADALAKKEKDEAKQEEKVEEPTPSNQQLVLTSTLVGGGNRLAVINGGVYAEDETVKSGKDVEFVVMKISREGVVLERNGQLYELKLDPGNENLVTIRQSN